VLEQAANKGCIEDLKAVHDRLRKTDFYISDDILNDSLAGHLAYKQAKTATERTNDQQKDKDLKR